MKRLWVMLIFIVVASAGKITLETLASMEVEELRSGQMVEVTHSLEIDPDYVFDPLEREYYVIKVSHRDKRSAYLMMNEMVERVVFVLKKFKVIPHERSLVKSKIKPQYQSKKRKWSFSTMFVVLGQPEQLKKCYGYFIRMGIQKLSAKPSINFLNQKVKALQLFATAKAKLDNELKRFPNFQIHQIEEIQIDGLHMPNSDLIEKQIEEEFSDSEENMEETQIQNEHQQGGMEKLAVRVVFEVIEHGVEEDSLGDFQQDEDDHDEDSDETEDDTEEESM